MFNDSNYLQYLKGLNVVLVEGESCANCISVKYTLSQIQAEMNFNLYSLQVDKDLKEFISKYKISSVPSIMVFDDDNLIALAKGYQPKEILEIWLKTKLSGKR